ncbi:hypothetical protein [Microbacterium sp. UBA3486]|uniref:hypothetical protein n=1 Tax=Microbacterium TaxID=33882 RepID=UPI0025E8F9E4|nr:MULTISPECIES: hypothetical protein [Microbacterium]
MILECSTFLSPLVEPEDVMGAAVALHQDVAAWLPEAEVIWLYARERTLSTYGKWLRARMDAEGLRVSTRGSVIVGQQRSRMLWHVRPGEISRPEGNFEYDLQADRVREFIVETGAMFDGQFIADEVAAYKALMSFPS